MEFSNAEDAQKAFEERKGEVIDDREVSLDFAQERGQGGKFPAPFVVTLLSVLMPIASNVALTAHSNIYVCDTALAFNSSAHHNLWL